MDSNNLDEKFNAILKSDSSLEGKIERVFFELKPNGTKEEIINYFLYWLNNLIIDDGEYEKVSFADLKDLFDDIVYTMQNEDNDTINDYDHYYGKINVLLHKIMNVIIFKSNNRKIDILEPSSLLNLEQEMVEPDSDADKIERIKALYARKMEAAITRYKLIKQLSDIQSEIALNKESQNEIDKELDDIFKGGTI